MKRKAFNILLTGFIYFSLSSPVLAEAIPEINKEETGKVVGIKDGDTIQVLMGQKTVTVRLAHVDCPEKKQPYGTVARHFTSAKCFGQQITLKHAGKYDRYRRLIAEVINESGVNVNRELVKAGLAWHFKKYSKDFTYAQLEKTARLHKKGLWKDPSPVAPWEWRP